MGESSAPVIIAQYRRCEAEIGNGQDAHRAVGRGVARLVHDPAGNKSEVSGFDRSPLFAYKDFPMALEDYEQRLVGVLVTFVATPRGNQDDSGVEGLGLGKRLALDRKVDS